LRLGKIVGNIVSTVKDPTHHGLKLLVARFIDTNGRFISDEMVCTDCADAGIGDTVLINDDGGAAQIALNDDEVIIDHVVVGVVDYYQINGEMIYPQ